MVGMPQLPRVPDGPSGVAVDVEQHDSAVVLHLRGELDMVTTARMTEAIDRALVDRPEILVIDLGKVTFLASSAMAALVAAHQSGADRTRVCVVTNGPRLTRILQLTGLDDILSLYPSVETALAG